MRPVDEQLHNLRDLITRMCQHATTMIQISTTALGSRDLSQAATLNQLEQEVNTLQREVDDQCSKLLALKQPVANDLRFIISAMKISADLERIGDQSISLLNHCRKLTEYPDVNPTTGIPKMSGLVINMVTDAVSAFLSGDTATAREILLRDDDVDAMKEQVIQDLMDFMISDPRAIKPGLQLVLTARNLERIADHATNIAEDCVYLVESKDVRHHAEESEQA